MTNRTTVKETPCLQTRQNIKQIEIVKDMDNFFLFNEIEKGFLRTFF